MSIIMIGLDTVKSVFQVHAVNESGKVETKRKLQRSEFLPFFEKQEGCIVILGRDPRRAGFPALPIGQ